MRAALAHLAVLAGGRRRVAVLGEMAELGDRAAAFHRELGAAVASCGVPSSSRSARSPASTDADGVANG